MKNIKVKLVSICLMISILISICPLSLSADDTVESMTITILDVGHGDAAVIESNGHYMVVDGGKYSTNDKILSFLKNKGVEKVDLVVSSHWDGDHIGGLNQVIRQYPVDTVWYSEYFVDNALTQNVKEAIEMNGCKNYVPKTGETYTVGDATVEVIYDGRNAEQVTANKTKDNVSNNSSVVVKVTCAGKSALFMGDARSEVEDKLPVNKVNCDILKVSHHGNYYSTSAKFIKNTSPQYAAISVKDKSRGGAPNFHIMYNLSEAGVIVGRTDKHGTLTYTVSAAGIITSSEKKSPDISKAVIKGIKKSYKKDRKGVKPIPRVKLNGKTLYSMESKMCYTTTSKNTCFHYARKCKPIKKIKNKFIRKLSAAKCKSMKKRACGWCAKSSYDYKIVYSNNKKKGTATITLIGLGDTCSGTVTRTFTIK